MLLMNNPNDTKRSSNAANLPSENKRLSESDKGNQRPPSPAPFALHLEGDRNKGNKSPSSSFSQSSSLQAPYAQPVLDASKVQASKKITTSVDERLATVRERRLQQQQVHGESLHARLAREEAARDKWTQAQEEKKKKAVEQKERENLRRKEVEERKNRILEEEKKRAEAKVAKTEQQSNVVLRQKRAASADRSKRWSWGAGGVAGGNGGMPLATQVESAPSPFHYYDPTRITKRISNDRQRRRPVSMDISQYEHLVHMGDESSNASNSGASSIIGQSKSPADEKFSKSPLVVGTAHIKFASGLRSYDSTPPSAYRKSTSPAPMKSRRARSTDLHSRLRSSASGNEQTSNRSLENNEKRPITRGRSPDVRKSPNSKASSTSPQLTEPAAVSSRLLAPTRASLARSINRDLDQLSTPSSTMNFPLRSRSGDRKRPSSAKSDSSSASSTVTSPREPSKSRTRDGTRGTSPLSRRKPRPPSPITTNRSPAVPNQRGESAKLKSPVVKDPPKPAKRPPSPGRTTPRNSSADRKTPNREPILSSKATPPTIKQSLTPTSAISRSKPSPTSSANPTVLSKKVQKKMQVDQTVKKPRKTKVAIMTMRWPSDGEPLFLSVDSVPSDESKQVLPSVVPEPKLPVVSHEAVRPVAEPTAIQRAEPVGETAQVDANEEDENSAANVEEEKQVEEISSETNQATTSNDVSLADELRNSSFDREETTTLPQPDLTRDTDHVTSTSLEADNSAQTISHALVSTLADEAINGAEKDVQREVDDEEEEVARNKDQPPTTVDALEPPPEEPSHEVPQVIPTEETDAAAKEENIQPIPPVAQSTTAAPQEENKKKENTQPIPPVPQATTAAPQEENKKKENIQPIPPVAQSTTAAPQEENKKKENTQPIPPVPQATTTAPQEENKKKEKKLTAEEQAYKDAIAAKRREMKEKREREERERQERLRIEAEEQALREEDARRMAEEARLEHERVMEEEKRKKEEQEIKKKKEAEEMARKHEEFLREKREELEQKAREEAERVKRDRELAAQKKDEERLARKKRLEMIMRRTRGGDSPTNNMANNSATPSGEQSPANATPTGGSSPINSLTPERINSPVNVEERRSGDNKTMNSVPLMTSSDEILGKSQSDPSDVETISLNNSFPGEEMKVNGNNHPPAPLVAFQDPLTSTDEGSTLHFTDDFDPLARSNPSNKLHMNGADEMNKKSDDTFIAPPDSNQVPTGNLLDL